MRLDLLYLAWNRLRFTQASFTTMVENTDWCSVRKLVVIDDTSQDGTFEFLQEAIKTVPVPVTLDRKEYRSPVMMMNEYLRHADSDWFCKIDNDIMLPPDWLLKMLSVISKYERRPEPIELLGMEAGMGGRPDPADWNGIYDFEPASHIGGVGLMRTKSFKRLGEIGASGRFGFTEYQSRHNMIRGWITPSLPVASLDRVPIEPWRSLSEEYVEKHWQRNWPSYRIDTPIWWSWFSDNTGALLDQGQGE